MSIVINPYRNINFRISFLLKEETGYFDFSDYIKSISIPSLTLNSVNTGFMNRQVKVYGETPEYSNIYCSFLLNEDMQPLLKLYDWIFKSTEESKHDKVYANAIVELLDTYQKPLAQIEMTGVHPENVDEIALDTGMDNEPVIISANFSYNELLYRKV